MHEEGKKKGGRERKGGGQKRRRKKGGEKERRFTGNQTYRTFRVVGQIKALTVDLLHACTIIALTYTVIWFIFVLKIISVFNFGGDLISFYDQTKFI